MDVIDKTIDELYMFGKVTVANSSEAVVRGWVNEINRRLEVHGLLWRVEGDVSNGIISIVERDDDA